MWENINYIITKTNITNKEKTAFFISKYNYSEEKELYYFEINSDDNNKVFKITEIEKSCSSSSVKYQGESVSYAQKEEELIIKRELTSDEQEKLFKEIIENEDARSSIGKIIGNDKMLQLIGKFANTKEKIIYCLAKIEEFNLKHVKEEYIPVVAPYAIRMNKPKVIHSIPEEKYTPQIVCAEIMKNGPQYFSGDHFGNHIVKKIELPNHIDNLETYIQVCRALYYYQININFNDYGEILCVKDTLNPKIIDIRDYIPDKYIPEIYEKLVRRYGISQVPLEERTLRMVIEDFENTLFKIALEYKKNYNNKTSFSKDGKTVTRNQEVASYQNESKKTVDSAGTLYDEVCQIMRRKINSIPANLYQGFYKKIIKDEEITPFWEYKPTEGMEKMYEEFDKILNRDDIRKRMIEQDRTLPKHVATRTSKRKIRTRSLTKLYSQLSQNTGIPF